MGAKPGVGFKHILIRNGYNVVKVLIRRGHKTISFLHRTIDLQVRRITQFEGSERARPTHVWT